MLSAGAAAYAAVLLAGGYVGFAYAAARRLLRPPRLVCDWHPGVLGLEYEPLEARAPDGVPLRGWFVRGERSATIVIIHGYTRSRWDDKYVCPSLYMLARRGFSVAVFDLRGHGESGGSMTYLGARELRDALAVIGEVRRRHPREAERVGVLGFSLGGAVAVRLAASTDPAAEPVKAVVADSPYVDILESARGWVSRYPTAARLLLRAAFPLITALASAMLGASPRELSIRPYARRVRRPLLIVAGERDDLVPLRSIKGFYEEARGSGAPVELWVTPSGHVESLRDDPRGYEERVAGFFERWLCRG